MLASPSASPCRQLFRSARRRMVRHSLRHGAHSHYYAIALILLVYTYITLSAPTPPADSLTEPRLPFAASLYSRDASSQPLSAGLVWVQLLHRHGDRNPIHVLPASAEWENYTLPPGSLTSLGWLQQQTVGLWLRQRYMINDSFLLNSTYWPHSLQVRSTEVERCMQSVAAILSTLYPPELDDSAVEETEAAHRTLLPPFPPIDVMPIALDMLLQSTDKCPAASLTYAASMQETDAIIDSRYPWLYDVVRNVTGFTEQDVGGSVSLLVSWTADNLLCEAAHSLSTNAQLTANFSLLTNLSKLVSFTRWATQPDDPSGAVGDLLLRDIAQHVLEKIRVQEAGEMEETGNGTAASWDDPYVQEQMRIYSAHDTTVVALLASLRQLQNDSFFLLPPYATMLTLELRRDTTGDYFVTWRIGYPVPDATASSGWIMQDTEMQAPCPGDDVVDRAAVMPTSSQCSVGSFLRYVLIATNPQYDSSNAAIVATLPNSSSTPQQLLTLLVPPLAPFDPFRIMSSPLPLYTYPPNDGCCVPPPNLDSLCPLDSPPASLLSPCGLMRRLCPSSACGGGVVDFATWSCLQANEQSSSEVKDGVILGATLIIALLLCAIAIQWKRGIAPAGGAAGAGAGAVVVKSAGGLAGALSGSKQGKYVTVGREDTQDDDDDEEGGEADWHARDPKEAKRAAARAQQKAAAARQAVKGATGEAAGMDDPAAPSEAKGGSAKAPSVSAMVAKVKAGIAERQRRQQRQRDAVEDETLELTDLEQLGVNEVDDADVLQSDDEEQDEADRGAHAVIQ